MIQFLETISFKKLIFILLLSSLLYRGIFLFWGVPGLTHDEVDLYYTGYTLSKTGSDQFDNRFFLTSGYLTAKPSIPIYLSALSWTLLPEKNILLSRLPFTLLNVFIPVLFFLIINRLSKNRILAVLAFIIFNFSPWFSYLSVTGYEGFVALLFVLLSLYILLIDINVKWKYGLFTLTSFLAFNSYMGFRLVLPFTIFLFLTISQSYYGRVLEWKGLVKNFLIGTAMFAVFMTIGYIAPETSLLKQDASRSLLILNKEEVTRKVEYDRLTSSGPSFLVELTSNKLITVKRDFVEKYFYSFHLPVVFFNGDPSVYGTSNLSGLFYPTDFIFFLIGVLFLIKIKSKEIKLLLLIFFFGGIPIGLSANTPTVIFRGLLLIIPYTILIAYGVYYLSKNYSSKIVLSIFFIFLVANTVFFYTLFQIRIVNMISTTWHTTEKKVFDKLEVLKPENRKITIYNQEPRPTFILYAFYKMKDTKKAKELLNNNNYSVDNISFSDGCPKSFTPPKGELYIIKKINCPSLPTVDVFISAEDKSGDDYFLLR